MVGIPRPSKNTAKQAKHMVKVLLFFGPQTNLWVLGGCRYRYIQTGLTGAPSTSRDVI